MGKPFSVRFRDEADIGTTIFSSYSPMMMRFRKTLLIAIISSMCLVSCKHVQTNHSAAFINPDILLGERIKACGVKSDIANFSPVKLDDGRKIEGLSIVDHGTLDRSKRGRLCFAGTIVYLGCGTKKILCTDAAYEYGIKID